VESSVGVAESSKPRIVRMSYPQIPSGGFDYILLDRKVVDAFNSV